jgi:hypothetical protein
MRQDEWQGESAGFSRSLPETSGRVISCWRGGDERYNAALATAKLNEWEIFSCLEFDSSNARFAT